MGKPEFCHLHVHSHYSLLDGANRIDDLIDAAVTDGQPALALTDHGNMFGAVELYQKCRDKGIKPIIGCEIYLAKDSRLKKHHKQANPYYHLTLLAQNAEGYRNLVAIASEAYVNGYSMRPRVDKEFLAEHAHGIIALSGCLSGEVNRLFLDGEDEEAMRAAGFYQDIFGKENFYLELQRNGMEIQAQVTEKMVRLADRTGMPLVGTNDIHYMRHEDCAAQDVLICIQTGARVNDEKRWRMDTDTLWFRSAEEMQDIFRDLPVCLENTIRIAEQVDFEMELGKYRFPAFDTGSKETPTEMFERLCREGFDRLYDEPTQVHRDRLDYELNVIKSMGFIEYFLITWDFIRHSRDIGVPVGPGRGSAAGSIVAYTLGITQIDPIKYDLLFERFLNSERISMPDIDIDFCRDGRERVIQYVRQKYGEDCVAQIITFNTMASRLAVRDVGRALDIPLNEVDAIAKKVPDGPKASLRKALEEDPELQEVRRSDERYDQLLTLAAALEGLARHAGVHAAGIVIADEPLRNIVPLYRNKEDITTQYPMSDLESVGLLKMDFLGLKTLTIIDKCLKLIQLHHRLDLDLDAACRNFDDEKTYQLLTAGNTLGVFQLESGGMRRLLGQLKPDTFEDLIAILALYRPGPLGSGMVDTFVECKHGRQKIHYPHPDLAPVLKDTYGVIVYQEQVMRIANILGGFTLNEADALRKAMGKKKPEIMDKFRSKFVEGAKTRNVAEKVATEIWRLMEHFGGYGFNKSHSTAYALITYQTAYLKANYPIEFLAANMTCESGDTDKVKEFVDDALALGFQVLPPCVNHSLGDFAIEGGRIRYALEAIKGMGHKAVEAILAAREELGRGFASIHEFCERCDHQAVGKGAIEALCKAGAFDAFGWDRGVVFAEIEDAIALGAQTQKDRNIGQGNLFDLLDDEPSASKGSSAVAKKVEPSHPKAVWNLRDRLAHERDAIGFYLSLHPMDRISHLAEAIADCPVNDVTGADANVTLVGMVTGLQERMVNKGRSAGKRMARFHLEDRSGLIQVVVFPDLYAQVRDRLANDRIVTVVGKASQRGEEEGPVEVIAQTVDTLDTGLRRFGGLVSIRLEESDRERLEELVQIVDRHRGRQPLVLEVRTNDGPRRVRASAAFRVEATEALHEEIRELFGEDRLFLIRPRAHRQELN